MLPRQSLKPVRLVCRAFHAACAERAQISTTCLSEARKQLEHLPSEVKLSAEFHSMDQTALGCLRASKLRICDLTICAACDVRGCNTQGHAVVQPERFAASPGFAGFIAEIAQATRLTNLILRSSEILAAPLVNALPQLQSLRIYPKHRQDVLPRQSEMISALRQSADLTLLRLDSLTNWMPLLPALANLPKLRSVGTVYVTVKHVVTLLTALTQLTSLGLNTGRLQDSIANGAFFRTWRTHLSKLSSLQQLEVAAFSSQGSYLCEGIQGLVTLERLLIRVHPDADPNEIGPFAPGPGSESWNLIRQMLQPLSRLSFLSLLCVLRPYDVYFIHNELPDSLRQLRLIIGDPPPQGAAINVVPPLVAAVGLAPTLSRLEELRLFVQEQAALVVFAPQLSACVNLKELVLCGPKSCAADVVNPSFSVLSSLTKLTRLILDAALDPHHAAIDIPCLAHLSALQFLGISWTRMSPEALDSEERNSRVHLVLLRNVDLRTLSSLWRLRHCEIDGMRWMRSGGTRSFDFKKSLHESQRTNDMPLAEVVDPGITFHGASRKQVLPLLLHDAPYMSLS